MSETVISSALAVIGALFGGVVVAFANGFMVRRKTDAEAESIRASAAKIANDTTLALIGDLRTEARRLSDRLKETEDRLGATQARADVAEFRASAAEFNVTLLQRAVDEYRRRVDYLTEKMTEAGITMERWIPPHHPKAGENDGRS